jgi:hypothetical protein
MRKIRLKEFQKLTQVPLAGLQGSREERVINPVVRNKGVLKEVMLNRVRKAE